VHHNSGLNDLARWIYNTSNGTLGTDGIPLATADVN
jgi:hypothetical protein